MEAESNAYALDSTILDCLRVLEQPTFCKPSNLSSSPFWASAAAAGLR
jgi:hypothetical protein